MTCSTPPSPSASPALSDYSERPLIITDCDEVLLHMVVPFAEWVDVDHDIEFQFIGGDFASAMRYRSSGAFATREEMWGLLAEFFENEMSRQYPVVGAFAALHALAKIADIVVLSNVGADNQDRRAVQLARYGLTCPVIGSHGGKGIPVRQLIDAKQPPLAIFIDDLAVHHRSVAEEAPHVWRLHMICEPRLATITKPAADAHARIDDWTKAQQWIEKTIAQRKPAPPLASSESQTPQARSSAPTLDKTSAHKDVAHVA